MGNNQGEQVQQSDAHSEASYNKLEDEIRNADEAIEELKEELVEHEREEELEEEIREEEMAYYAYDNFERGYDDGSYDQPSTYGLSFIHFMIVGFCVLGTCIACYLGAGGMIMSGYFLGKQGYLEIDGD